VKSLGSRLALLYAFVSTATLVLLFVAGYYLLHQYLVHGLDLLNEAEFEQIKVTSVLFFIDVHAQSRGVLFSSTNLSGQRIPDVPGEHRYNATLAGLGELRVGEFLLDKLDVTVATSLSQVHKVMDGYAEISLVLVCLMLVLSLITGFALSRTALRPVRLIQETANHIRSDNLSERIPVADVRDEISQLARLLNEMFDRLESSFTQIQQFSAVASHELKTPLALVRLQAERLLVQGGLRPEQEEALQLQLEEIARLHKIIEDLLFLSRVEAQGVTPELRRSDPRPFLEAFAQDAGALAESRGVRFAATLVGAGLVDFDPKWIRQVLLNLLANALRYSPRGGLVTLASEFTVDHWRVALEDGGPGVPPEQRERIFERFVRLDAGGPAGEAGSGLGLTISRGIIARHHGSIRAEASTRGPGLRVVFELPIAGSGRNEARPAAADAVTTTR
jgi:signal transduction histidine kinase